MEKNRRGWKMGAATVALLLPCTAFALMSVVPGTPAGFETLEAPRTTFVTLYYGGELLGNFRAEFSPTQLAFSAPLDIIDAIPTISDQGAVGSALSSPLPTNAGLICGSKPREGCGRLAPDVAGVIFDENHLTAELFINAHYLALTEQNAARYLPLPARNFSSVYRFDGAVSGTEQASPNFALSNTAVHAFGEANLATETTLTNRGLRFDEASAGVEREGWSASGGLMRSFALQLAGDRDIAGFSLASSLRTRLDVRKTEGNDLIVYLPRQAFVSIYRDGRLYSSHNYEAGNQRLDTSELPNGAYNVTLKIQEANGDTRDETRFFAKSEQIPPPDAPTYYLQGGMVRVPASQDSTLPEFTDKPLFEMGTVWRIEDNVGLSIGALGLNDRVAAESSLFMVAPDTQLRATALASSAGDVGVQSNLLYIRPTWNMALDARRLWAGEALSTDYDELLSDLTQASATATYNLTPTVDLSLRGSYVASSDMPTSTSIGPELDWRLWQEGESLLTFSTNAAHVSGENQATAFLRFSYKLGDNGITGESGYGHGGGANGAYESTRVWRNKTTADDSLLMGAGAQADGRTRNVSADADWRTNFGRINGAIQHSIGSDSLTSYGGNFAVGAAQAEDMVHLGGNEADMSAVVVETAGDAETELTIFVNSTPHGTVKTGERQVIYLPPYNIYHIRVAPTKPGLFEVAGGDRKVTLYPGNVVRLSWQVDNFMVVSAQIVTPDGAPLANATLAESCTNIVTDSKGRFQAELTHPHTLTFANPQGQQCRVTLPPVKLSNGVLLYKEKLTCQ